MLGALLMLFGVPPASAAPFTLTNANSVVTIDPGSQFGAYDWTVDGDNVLYQQWFWYRVGGGSEASIDTLSLSAAGASDLDLDGFNDALYLKYLGAGFMVEVKYSLTGGTAGSHNSDIAETIKISNTGTSSLDFHFFQYSDFDLGPGLQDWVTIGANKQSAKQVPVGGGLSMSETVITASGGFEPVSHAEAGYYASTRNKLNDGVATTLNDVLVAGPGDVTWAFQWDKTVAAGGSFIISKDKSVGPAVPEPAAILMLGTCVVLLGRKFRRKFAA